MFLLIIAFKTKIFPHKQSPFDRLSHLSLFSLIKTLSRALKSTHQEKSLSYLLGYKILEKGYFKSASLCPIDSKERLFLFKRLYGFLFYPFFRQTLKKNSQKTTPLYVIKGTQIKA